MFWRPFWSNTAIEIKSHLFNLRRRGVEGYIFSGNSYKTSRIQLRRYALFSRFPNSSDCSTVGLDEIISGSRISNQSTNRRCVELFNSPLQVKTVNVSVVNTYTCEEKNVGLFYLVFIVQWCQHSLEIGGIRATQGGLMVSRSL